MLTKYPTVNEKWNDENLAEKWDKIISLKNSASKELELARADKLIGNSLDALLKIEADKDNYEFFKENEELIRKVLIVSELEIVKGKELAFKVEHARGEKCERCWQYSEEIEDGLCKRCHKIIHEN